MENNLKQKQVVPPYVSFKTFSSAISSLADQGIPVQIDRSVLSKYSGGVQSQLMLTFKFFGLTDKDDRPTEKFREYVNASPDQQIEILGGLLRSCFPKQIENLHHGTIQQLTDSFNDIKAKSSVKEKCIAFFLKAAQEAQLDISKHIMSGKRAKQQREGTTKRRGKAGKAKDKEREEPHQEEFGQTEGMSILSIPLGLNKAWNIQVDDKYNKKDVDAFIQMIKMVLEREIEEE